MTFRRSLLMFEGFSFQGPGKASRKYIFPRHNIKYRAKLPSRTRFDRVAGMPYAIDRYGLSGIPPAEAPEEIEFDLIGDTIDEVNALIQDCIVNLRLIDQGYLWLVEGANRYWSWARLVNFYEYDWNFDDRISVTMKAAFIRTSEWQEATATVVSEVVTANEQQWVVNNPGPFAVFDVTIRITANANGGVNNPILENFTASANGLPAVWEHDRVLATTGHFIQLNTSIPAVEVQTGLFPVNDWPNYVFPPVSTGLQTYTRPAQFAVVPGNNTFFYDSADTPNATVTVTFYAAHG